MTAEKITFSIQEVNERIPELEKLIEYLIGKKEEFSKNHDVLFMEELLKEAEGNQANDDNLEEIQGFEEAIHTFQEDLQKIKSLGGILRSLEKGIVDFPGKHNDEIIYFVWQKGESEIQFYRKIGDDSQDRHKLEE